MAVAEAVTALLDGVTSPLLAVANRAVDLTPRPVKEWAIETFCSADKQVLIGGVIGTVALLAVAAGVLGTRRPRTAVGAFVLLSGIAAAAAVTDRAATAGPALRLLPVAALVGVGGPSLVVLLRRLPRRGPAARAAGDDLQVDDANVICGGVHTANATVYLIDSVLMPKM